MAKLMSRFAALFLTTTLAFSSVASASPAFTAVAEIFSRYSARFFLSQTADGQVFARRVLGHRIRTNRDFQRFILGYDSSRLTAAERAELRRHIDDLERTAESSASRFELMARTEREGALWYGFNREAAEKLSYRLANTDPRFQGFVPTKLPSGFLASRDRFLHSAPGLNPVTDGEVARLASDLARNGGISLGRSNLYPNRGLPTRNQAYRAYLSQSGHRLGDVTVDLTLRNSATSGQPSWTIDPIVGLRSDAYFGANRSVELELAATRTRILDGVETETRLFKGHFDEVTNSYPVEIIAEVTGRRVLVNGQAVVDFTTAPVVKLSARPLLRR